MVFGGRWCPKGCGKTVITKGFSQNTSLACGKCHYTWRDIDEYEATYQEIEVID